MGEVLDLGGRVHIEVVTQHTFTGEGAYSYWEMLLVVALNVSLKTVQRDWLLARAWLQKEIEQADALPPSPDP